MNNDNFLPGWYLEGKRDKKNKIINVFIIIMVTLNISIIILTLFLFNVRKNIQSNCKEAITIVNKKEEKVKNKTDDCMQNYKKFYEFSKQNNIKYEEYSLTLNKISANIIVKDKQEYVNKIGALEKIYIIKSISIPTKDKKIYKFKVEMEFNE